MGPQVSRAQLLLALHQRQISALTLEHTDEAWWGFEAQEAPETAAPEHSVTLGFPEQAGAKVSDQTKQGLPPPRNPLQMPEAWVAWWMGSEPGDDNQPNDTKLEALTAEELNPADEPMVSYQDLVPLPRLLPALLKQVRVVEPGGLDVKRLIIASAKRQWPARLPRTQRSSWPQHLLLLLDCRVELYPYRYDFFRLASALQALVPASQISIYVGEGGPDGLWESWSTQQAAERQVIEGLPKESGATVLILSELGLHCPKQGMHQQWLKALQARGQAGHSIFALAPVEAYQVPKTMAELVQVLRWSPNSRFRPERGRQGMAAQGEQERDEAIALDQLLACVGAVLRMDPPLLRAMRQASHWPSHAGLEGQVWAHAQVSGTSYASLKGGVEQGRALAPAIADVLSKASGTHHAHWSLGMRVVDNMRLLGNSKEPEQGLLLRTRRDLLRLASPRSERDPVSTEVKRVTSYVLRLVPMSVRPWLGDALAALAESLGMATKARLSWSLVQRGSELVLLPTEEGASFIGCTLFADVGVASPGEPVMVQRPGRSAELLPLPASGGLTLPVVEDGSQVIVGGQMFRLRTIKRKNGATAWDRSPKGLNGKALLPWNEEIEFDIRTERGLRWLTIDGERRFRFGAMFGFDRYGLYLELGSFEPTDPVTKEGRLTAFRYLPPATFRMGSPEGVGHDDEHPQHPVTLTQGLWLAETPCTQALWQAVMGHNPSHFNKGSEAPLRPVEGVSWDDVQQFLAKLNTLLPEGCKAVLPTEAQWEYACRAGTETAYWWGNEPDDTKSNFNMKDEKSIADEDGTTPIDRYPPNPWGFRDMHGNVWEWCADRLRTYEQDTTCDPMGDALGDARVVRGGSWLARPSDCSSANRREWSLDGRGLNRGFRFALRSSSHQGEEPQPGGPKVDDGPHKGGASGGRTASGGASGKAIRSNDRKKESR